jgi:hypothetical protein
MMRTFLVSYVNAYGFRIVTTHYDEIGVQLRLAELARAGITEATVSEPAPPRPAPTQRKAAHSE